MTRSAAEIGAGLAAPREPREVRPDEVIHVVGIGGAGASAAAILAAAAGARVSGCDPGGPSPYTVAVEAAGIIPAWQHDPGHTASVPPPDRLAVTKALTAIAADHPELAAARAARIPLEPWHQVVADAAVGRTLVAVGGTHGKSTTAGWLVHVLVAADRDPSAFVGALLPAADARGLPSTARVGSGAEFVVEADEYAGNFDAYRPAVAIVTNVEWDHPDVFRDLDATLDAFEGWVRRARGTTAEGGRLGPRPILVLNSGDAGACALRDRLVEGDGAWAGEIAEFEVRDTPDLDAAADLGAAEDLDATEEPDPSTTASRTRLTAVIVEASEQGTIIELRGSVLVAPLRAVLRTAGRHNAANAAAVAAAALVLGVDAQTVADALGTFAGVGRRLERLGEANGVVVYDDYGHHPTAIRATLAAIRQLEPDRRVWAVYEPLTYHRTAALLEPFAEALSGADAVAVATIWAGRDPDTTVASAEGLAEAVQRHRPQIEVAAPGSVESTAAWLATRVRPGDAVLVMGGGHSYRIGRLLLEARAT